MCPDILDNLHILENDNLIWKTDHYKELINCLLNLRKTTIREFSRESWYWIAISHFNQWRINYSSLELIYAYTLAHSNQTAAQNTTVPVASPVLFINWKAELLRYINWRCWCQLLLQLGLLQPSMHCCYIRDY